MLNTITILQVISAIILTILVLMQNRGGGLGDVFGGGGSNSAYRTKRGMEKKIFWATCTLGALFVILAVLNLIF